MPNVLPELLALGLVSFAPALLAGFFDGPIVARYLANHEGKLLHVDSITMEESRNNCMDCIKLGYCRAMDIEQKRRRRKIAALQAFGLEIQEFGLDVDKSACHEHPITQNLIAPCGMRNQARCGMELRMPGNHASRFILRSRAW